MSACVHRTAYGQVGPCYACARSALTERLEWWRRDIAYKAPEQVDKAYAVSIVHDLIAFISPSMVLRDPLGSGECGDCECWDAATCYKRNSLPQNECDECYARVEHQHVKPELDVRDVIEVIGSLFPSVDEPTGPELAYGNAIQDAIDTVARLARQQA